MIHRLFVGALAIGGLMVAPLLVQPSHAASPRPISHVIDRRAPMRGAATSSGRPRAVAVYVGAALVASGQSLRQSLRRVQPLVPFPLFIVGTAPRGFVPTQLVVIPQQRGVSDGFSALVYVVPTRPHSVAGTRGFVLQQQRARFVFEGANRTAALSLQGRPGTLYEFRSAGRCLLILTGTTAAGNGFAISSETTLSQLSAATLQQAAGSLQG